MTSTEWVWQWTHMEYSEWVTEYSEHRMSPQHAVAIHAEVSVGIVNADYG